MSRTWSMTHTRFKKEWEWSRKTRKNRFSSLHFNKEDAVVCSKWRRLIHQYRLVNIVVTAEVWFVNESVISSPGWSWNSVCKTNVLLSQCYKEKCNNRMLALGGIHTLSVATTSQQQNMIKWPNNDNVIIEVKICIQKW